VKPAAYVRPRPLAEPDEQPLRPLTEPDGRPLPPTQPSVFSSGTLKGRLLEPSVGNSTRVAGTPAKGVLSGR